MRIGPNSAPGSRRAPKATAANRLKQGLAHSEYSCMQISIARPPQPKSMAANIAVSQNPANQYSQRISFTGGMPRSANDPTSSGETNAATALQVKASAMYRSSPACFSTLLNETVHRPSANHWKRNRIASGRKVALGVGPRMICRA